MNRTKKIIAMLILLLTAAVAAFNLTGCAQEAKGESQNETKEKKEEIVTLVQVTKPSYDYAMEEFSFSGVTVPEKSATASFLVSGKINSMNYEVSQRVKKGDLLATIDSEIYERQVGVASASVRVAEAQVMKVNSGARPQEIDMARRQMLQAKSGFELAQKEKERFDRLYKIDAIPGRDHDQVVTQFEIAREKFKAAREQYELVKEGASREDRIVASSGVDVHRAQLAQAATQLKYTKLYSPIDGIITEKKQETGAVVAPGKAIYEIQSIDRIDLEVYIPSVHIEKIRIGQEADVSFLEAPDAKIKGAVREIKPDSDKATRSYRVKLRLSSTPFLKSYSGTIGKAVFKSKDKTYGAFVPVACIVNATDSDENYVFIIDEDKRAHKIPVTILAFQDQKALIKGNFTKNASLVLSGQEYLHENSKVKIVGALDSQKNVTVDRADNNKNYGSRL